MKPFLGKNKNTVEGGGSKEEKKERKSVASNRKNHIRVITLLNQNGFCTMPFKF